MIDWSTIDTILLDMDGTLLDLNFDTHFWREHVPLRYAEMHGIDIESAREKLYPRFRAVEGTMDWYCVDYWSRELELDIAMLKEEVDHLIQVFPNVREFLDRLRQQNKHVVLVTNAHQKSLQLKMHRTQLAGHMDDIICAHELGLPKEEQSFWGRLHAMMPYDAEHTLLIDDNLSILRSARQYGIEHLLAVYQPDSAMPPRDTGEFPAIRGFADIMP
jgi:putative hydrolase of the HAD superfamily